MQLSRRSFVKAAAALVEAWLSGNDVEPGSKMNSPAGLGKV
jgi:hypothetical protein